MPPATADSPEVVALIHEGLPLVAAIARQVLRETGWRDYDDLLSAGREGLVKAARDFDPTFGVPFRRYMSIRVRGAMIDMMRGQGSLSRRAFARVQAIEAADLMSEAAAEDELQTPTKTPGEADAHLSSYLAGIATAMAIGLLATPVKHREASEEVDAIDDDESPDEKVAQTQLMTEIRNVIDAQPQTERHLLTRHYFDGVEFTVAAKELGLSKSWASRIHARAIDAVARELKRRGFGP